MYLYWPVAQCQSIDLWVSGLFQGLDLGSLVQKDCISFSKDFFIYRDESVMYESSSGKI